MHMKLIQQVLGLVKMWKILLLIIFFLQLEGNDGLWFRFGRNRRRNRHGRINKRDMLGCYRDAAHRVLEGGRTWGNYMTVGRCKSRCLKEKTRFYGVEAGNECFCGNTMRFKDRKSNNDCRMKCRGNNEACGGSWRIMIYKNPNFRTSRPRRKQRTIHVCEHRRQKLACGKGLEIRVRYAMYGRLSRSVCSKRSQRHKTTRCKARHSTRITKRLCNGKRVCNLHASNSVYGDPCVGTYKYLKVVYSCKKRRTRRRPKTIICEHRRRKLKCGRGKRIKVHYAMYGRLSRSVCSKRSQRHKTTRCKARHSTRITKRLCNGKRVCNLHASNSVYGDPCVGTYKYLKVVYSCRKHFVRRKDFVRRKGLVGCHVDGWYRTLGGAFRRSKYMTINKCLNICKRRRNMYAGVEYGRECFCGNDIRRKKKVALSQCKMPCSGYKKEGCGGTWRIAIYRTGVKNGNKCGRHKKCHSNGRCINGECRCKKGYTGDGVKRCYKTCSCTASGDPHYYTFDGLPIHFMGTCKYTLAKVKNSRSNVFNVEVKNEYHGRNRRVSYTRLVDIKLGKTTIRLHKYNKVYLNGVRIYLPYTRAGKFRIFRSGSKVKVIVDTAYGDATVTWNGRSTVVVTVPKNLGRRMTGLCGNCNGKKDDYRTKYGKDVSRLRNKFTLIGNSYAVTDDTDQIHKSCKAIETTNKCTPALRKKALDIKACGFINPGNKNGSPFRDCIVGSPGASKTMFENCVFDYCTYYDDKSQRKRTICQSVSGYAEFCAARMGISVKWRSDKFCPLPCGANMVYDSEMSGCPATCVDPDSEKTCDQPSSEGCRCMDGLVLSDNKCVPKSKCGCKGPDSKYYPLGARFTSSDCTTVQECKSMGGTPSFKTVLTKPKCANHQTCVVTNGSPTCLCNKGYISDGRSGCIAESPTCNDKKVDVQCLSPQGNKFVCTVPKAKTVVHVRSTSKLCKYGSTYGLSADGIWVSLGCKGAFSVCYIPVPAPGPSECLAHNDPEGKEYEGTLSLTEQGYTCQKWSTQSPHSHTYLKTTNNNHCRNPDNEKAPWCYTTDSKKRWDYCHIPVCPGKKAHPTSVKECLDVSDERGLKYAGHVHKTKSGKECQDWGRQRPHSHTFQKLADQGNFCRNPDNEPSPWCYTNSSDTRWEACSIPDCGECEIKQERSLKCEIVHKISGKCFFASSALSKCKFSLRLNKYRNGQSEARVIMANKAYSLQRGQTMHNCASFEMRTDILYVVEKLCEEKCTKPPVIVN